MSHSHLRSALLTVSRVCVHFLSQVLAKNDTFSLDHSAAFASHCCCFPSCLSQSAVMLCLCVLSFMLSCLLACLLVLFSLQCSTVSAQVYKKCYGTEACAESWRECAEDEPCSIDCFGCPLCGKRETNPFCFSHASKSTSSLSFSQFLTVLFSSSHDDASNSLLTALANPSSSPCFGKGRNNNIIIECQSGCCTHFQTGSSSSFHAMSCVLFAGLIAFPLFSFCATGVPYCHCKLLCRCCVNFCAM